MEKKTPLYDEHVACKGKIVPFAGYLLPVEYPTGLMAEHEAVRTKAGLFDVSHMGEVMFTGPTALATLNHLLTNEYSTLAPGRCRYAALCYDDGGMVDDLIVYRIDDEVFLVVVNAANKDKDVAWMADHLLEGTVMRDVSDEMAQLALQGPRALAILEGLADPAALPEKYYTFTREVDVAGAVCLVSRTGYTGEDGFELYCTPDQAAKLWRELLEAGADEGLVPCGLGARDTLRLEASMPLYGHEMDATIDPLEAGLGFAVKMDKDEFIGKQALVAKGTPARQRIGLRVTGRGIIRDGHDLFADGKLIGHTTSGTFCPHLKQACAMALVDAGCVAVGDAVEADVRGRRVQAEVVALPFYRRAR
ncbi:MAG: glycine cleavage system aminomethyltransferase GcvT [Gordonibacter sp.]